MLCVYRDLACFYSHPDLESRLQGLPKEGFPLRAFRVTVEVVAVKRVFTSTLMES